MRHWLQRGMQTAQLEGPCSAVLSIFKTQSSFVPGFDLEEDPRWSRSCEAAVLLVAAAVDIQPECHGGTVGKSPALRRGSAVGYTVVPQEAFFTNGLPMPWAAVLSKHRQVQQ
jgi:hypothetical protein